MTLKVGKPKEGSQKVRTNLADKYEAAHLINMPPVCTQPRILSSPLPAPALPGTRDEVVLAMLGIGEHLTCMPVHQPTAPANQQARICVLGLSDSFLINPV